MLRRPPLKDEPRRRSLAASKRVSLLAIGVEPAALAPVERLARDLGFEFASRGSAADCVEEIRRVRPDATVVDLGPRAAAGVETLRAIREVDGSCGVILLTSQPSLDSTIEALKMGALDCLPSPPDLDRLRGVLTTVAQDIERREALFRQDGQAARQFEFHGIVGRSAPMQDLFDTIRRLAPHVRALLITGEPGTGKELVARAVHRVGPRRDRRFVTLTCSAASDTSLESDLFGHERGAFPGASETRLGAFEQANGGTLFLDEIGAVPFGIQARLLRAIERGESQRMGAADVRRFDIHVLAATSRDLAADAAAGRFRRDLFERLRVFTIDVPALRERREDVPLLVAALLHERSGHRVVSGLTTAAERTLQHATWERNVRELTEVVERACSLADARLLGEREVLAAISAVSGEPVKRALATAAGEPADGDLLSSAERRQIERVLKRVGGNKTEAARLLGVSRRALYRWLERLGLNIPK